MPTIVQSFLIDYFHRNVQQVLALFFFPIFFFRSPPPFSLRSRSTKRKKKNVTIKSRSAATVLYRPFQSANWSGEKFRSSGPSRRLDQEEVGGLRENWQKAFFFLYLFAPAAQSQDVFVISRTEAAPLPLPSSYVRKFFATLPARC